MLVSVASVIGADEMEVNELIPSIITLEDFETYIYD